VKVSHVFAFLLAAGAAAAQETTGGGASARTGPVTVTYRSQTAVYVSAGRTSGLAVGDRLALLSGSERIAELEVLFSPTIPLPVVSCPRRGR
jgi:hypothetical protein